MESVSKKNGKVFKGKLAEIMVKIGIAEWKENQPEEPVEEIEDAEFEQEIAELEVPEVVDQVEEVQEETVEPAALIELEEPVEVDRNADATKNTPLVEVKIQPKVKKQVVRKPAEKKKGRPKKSKK